VPPPPVEETAPTALAVPAVVAPAAPARESPPARHPDRTVFYVVGTAGVASLAFGSVAGMQAIVRWNDRRKLCTGDVCSQAGLNADHSARAWALASDIGLGVGAVGVAAAAVLRGWSSSAEASRGGAWSVVPAVSPAGGGVGVNAIW